MRLTYNYCAVHKRPNFLSISQVFLFRRKKAVESCFADHVVHTLYVMQQLLIPEMLAWAQRMP